MRPEVERSRWPSLTRELTIYTQISRTTLWVNSGETGVDKKGKNKGSNGIDDDGNGCIDDIHGCNFINMTGNIRDLHGHGTHIAGIIGATRGNGVGVSGVAPHISMMILKYYDPAASGFNNLNNTVKAIHYAIQQGAHIINYSGGGTSPSVLEKRAIKLAEKKGILFVAGRRKREIQPRYGGSLLPGRLPLSQCHLSDSFRQVPSRSPNQ